ncbi:MAG: hypothetical protein IJR70_09440 [Eubacterium sp.]|nr:hypothetical protein [Eubacterium sp.]
MIQSGYNAMEEKRIINIFFQEDCKEEKNQLSISKREAMLLKILSEIKINKDGEQYA